MTIPIEKAEKAPASPRKPVTRRALTVAQKAEAAALWRAGTVTLDDLAKKFKKRPEAFSRLFAKMGIEKGAGVAAAVKKAEEAIATKMLTDAEMTLQRIAQVKDTHFRMSQSLAVMAFRELQQAKAAGLDVAKLKDSMQVYKLVSDVVGNSRKELFEILNVEKHERDGELDELPDLTIRELTQHEVDELSTAAPDELDSGGDMIDIEDDEIGT